METSGIAAGTRDPAFRADWEIRQQGDKRIGFWICDGRANCIQMKCEAEIATSL